MSRTFGDNLRCERLRLGLSQEALQRRLKLKRQNGISRWELSGILPEPATVVRIAKALGVSPAVLLDDVETPYDRLRAGKPLT